MSVSKVYTVTGWYFRESCMDLDQVRQTLYRLKGYGQQEWFEIFVEVHGRDEDMFELRGVKWRGDYKDLPDSGRLDNDVEGLLESFLTDFGKFFDATALVFKEMTEA